MTELIKKYMFYTQKSNETLETLRKLEDELNVELKKLTINEDVDLKALEVLYPKLKDIYHEWNMYQTNQKKIEDDLMSIYDIKRNDIPLLLVLYKYENPKPVEQEQKPQE